MPSMLQSSFRGPLGVFEVTITIGHPEGGDLAPVSATVDSGAGHTMLPASFLASLRIQPKEQQYFTIADGSEVLFGYRMARKAIDDEEWHCPVIFGPDGQYLLGATTLEIFGLAVDPYGSCLFPRQYRARAI